MVRHRRRSLQLVDPELKTMPQLAAARPRILSCVQEVFSTIGKAGFMARVEALDFRSLRSRVPPTC